MTSTETLDIIMRLVNEVAEQGTRINELKRAVGELQSQAALEETYRLEQNEQR